MVSTSQTEGAHPCGAAPFRYRRAWKRNPGRGGARTAREKKRALRGTLQLKRHLPSGSSCPLNRGDNSRLYHNLCLTPDLGFASIRPAPLRGGFSWSSSRAPLLAPSPLRTGLEGFPFIRLEHPKTP